MRFRRRRSIAAPSRDTDLVVLHADHSTSRGGAEYALLRILRTEHDWEGIVAVPGIASEPGVWEVLQAEQPGAVTFTGRSHSAGASGGTGVAKTVRFITQVWDQAIRIRIHPAFRRAHVLHANTSRAGLYVVMAAVMSKKPVVVHLRDIVDRPNLGLLGFILVTRFVLPLASGVIANSKASQRSAEPFLKASSPIEAIPSAAGVVPAAEVGPVGSRVRAIGMVARLDPWKGQALLLRAFADVYAGTDVRLVFAGRGEFGHDEFQTELEILARDLGIATQVEFAGHLDNIADFIRSLDICVQCSIRPEPLGQNVLQYLALGKPTIATSEGGPGEWVSNDVNGLTFPMGDVNGLAAALRRMSDPATRQRFAIAAARTPHLLNDTEVAARHAEFFRGVVLSSKTTRRHA